MCFDFRALPYFLAFWRNFWLFSRPNHKTLKFPSQLFSSKTNKQTRQKKWKSKLFVFLWDFLKIFADYFTNFTRKFLKKQYCELIEPKFVFEFWPKIKEFLDSSRFVSAMFPRLQFFKVLPPRFTCKISVKSSS